MRVGDTRTDRNETAVKHFWYKQDSYGQILVLPRASLQGKVFKLVKLFPFVSKAVSKYLFVRQHGSNTPLKAKKIKRVQS